MAIMMPVLVSPIFMVEVSTAAIIVSWWLGLSGIGWRLKCGIVESLVDLVERFGAALVLGIGCFVLGSVGVMLCRWWVVENYIWGLLLLCIV
jgi:hypothetical protein